jgi:sec-independent protein translocase protein TatC
MSFGDHLEELRKRILLALAFPVPAAILLYFISDTLIQWLLLPLFDVLNAFGLPAHVQQLSPPEAIVTRLKLSMIAALIISAPWVLWQAWKFIGPGLYAHERRFVRLLVPGSAILTIAAVAVTYFGMLPLMLRVLVAIGLAMNVKAPPADIDPRALEIIKQNPPMTILEFPPANPAPGRVWVIWPEMKRYVAIADANGAIVTLEAPRLSPGTVTQDFRLSEYVNFVLLFMLGTVIAFQMPLVVLLMGWLGLASASWLRANRKYALFICAIVAAVVTPSADLVSMLVMMVPLYGLYELGIILLVMAPASKVAEGRLFRLKSSRRTGSDNLREPMDQPRNPAQAELTLSRREPQDQRVFDDADPQEPRA